jgi:hypothetical protein
MRCDANPLRVHSTTAASVARSLVVEAAATFVDKPPLLFELNEMPTFHDEVLMPSHDSQTTEQLAFNQQ